VRTKWQSGSRLGDDLIQPLKGNRLIGNEGQAEGKSDPT